MPKVIDFRDPKYNKKVEILDIRLSCITGAEMLFLLSAINSLYKKMKPFLDPEQIRKNVNYNTDLDDDDKMYSILTIEEITHFMTIKIYSDNAYEELDEESLRSYIDYRLNLAEELADDLNKGILFAIEK